MQCGESFLNQSALCGAKSGFGSLTFKEGGEKVARKCVMACSPPGLICGPWMSDC